MKRKVAKLRLSPNEEARVLKEEHERRRKLRIQQVREQQRYIALQIRQAVEQKRQHELEQLEKQLKQDWERQQREKLDTLQRLYQESLQLLGQGHRSAKENEPDLATIAKKEEENHTKAEERYREALRELKSQRLKENERQNQFINARRKALQSEKERSAKVASLPPPPSNLIQSIDSRKSHVVKKSDVSAFAATHYHMSESTVDREADTEQLNANEEAELEARRLQDLQREEQTRREEQLEKARLRGRQALRREQLAQDRERLLVELEHMQQTDLLRRRQQVSQMPPQIFQPLYKRQETREDFQREMEFAFEDMYTGERRVKGDLVVQLVPEPLPALSTDSQDQELDITQDEVTTPGTENTQHDAEQEAASPEQEILAQEEPSRPPPRRALKKLLDRIRNQRSQWTGASSPTVFTDQIPERDTTIETGSLTSEEREQQPPTELPEPQVLETPEQSTAPDTQLPDVLANRIREFEDERKKREEELEKEKQKQMVLLQELEEQKAKLEQMLLEAQQEREHLKAAAAQEVAVNQADLPARDQEITSVASGQATELEPPAGEDDHTRRIREYQQRLLEQNRIHQRSVEVARQRLEEYQRALQIRYNMTSLSLLPTVVPPGPSHPHQHSIRSVHPPPPLQHPTPAVQSCIHRPQTPVEVPVRESDMLASPPCPTDSSLSSGYKVLQDEVESDLHCLRNQRPDCAWLTDKVMERVTEHLPERVRPSSLATEPLPQSVFTPRHSATISPQPTSDAIRAFSPTITDEAPLVPGYAAAQPGTTLHGSLHVGSLSSSEDDMEKQKRELQELQRRVLQQREAIALQQKQREEERRRQEVERQRQKVEMEQMRWQKEKLQALIQTDTQTVPEAKSEALVSENIGQTRLRLLASLLRAIEESNGGTLSHLEDPQEKDGSPQHYPCSSHETEPIAQTSVPVGGVPVSVFPSGHLPAPRAAKPPVTRVRQGIKELMTEQHELSVIQEVETPANISQVAGPDESLTAPSHTVNCDPHEESDESETTNRTLQTPSESSSEHRTAERQSSSGARRSKYLTLRERLLMGADSSDSDSALREISPLSSDSGRGADYSGPAITSYRSYTESPHRPPESDCLSSTTISTGSYITTDPEQNIDKSPSCEEERRGTDLYHHSSPSTQSLCINDRSAAVAVDSLFNDSSIQRIIDRYTRELNISLSTAGRTTDSEGSYVEEARSLLSQQSQVQDSERSGEHEGSAGHHSPPSQTSDQPQEGDNTVDSVYEHFSGGDLSQAEDPEQDSFRPLIGQLADQSSCLAADQRGLAMEHLVGQPSAHSSMIGHIPGLPVAVSLDQGGWDSTLSRMIGQLSHQSSFNWLSGGQDFYADQLMGQLVQEPSTTWLDEGQEESLMRPLVGELDNDQHSGSSGERTRVDLGVSTEARVPLYTALPPEASSHSSNIPSVSHHPEHQELQSRCHQMDSGPERSEVFPGSDSFHPLLAEITHNETVDPSMTFHLLEHNVPTSPEGQPATGRRSVPTPHEESETHSDPSPERLRTQHAVHESCQGQPQESVLTLDDTVRTDVELTAPNLSHFSMCDESNALDLPQPAGISAEANSISENLQLPGPFSDLCAEELMSEQGSHVRDELPVSDKTLEGLSEKGILEQSDITLVSLTDTTVQDQETTITEEDPVQEDKFPHRERGKGRTGQETEGSESILLPEDMVKDKDQTHQVTLQRFEWGPSGGLQQVNQQKRTTLLQRSARRVEAIKAKGALARIKSGNQTSSETREKSKAGKCQPVSSETKTEPEHQHGTNHKVKGRRAEQQQTDRSGFKLKQAQLPPPESDSRPKKMNVPNIHTPEQRKLDVSEMHQRTRRLYEQLEEVKHQKTIRSKQEAYAKNRQKAKEFHMKTLQKLRAKQTLQ